MAEQFENDNLRWLTMDLLDMSSIDAASVDLAFDKGAMECMADYPPQDPPDPVLKETGKYMKQVERVLKEDGVFICIMRKDPKYAKPLLERGVWRIKGVELMEVEREVSSYCYILTKASKAS